MFKLEEATIESIQKAVAAKEISYTELLLMYLERIAEVDSCEGGLNSVLEINPDALVVAQLYDDRKLADMPSAPLTGIPILLKDNINSWDKTHTTAGSLALSGSFAVGDADIVQNLRQNGAIIFGKTNMTEFANFMSDGMTNGYSSEGGYVKSPYNRDADPSGSSTGSAVAVAANLCAASVGTETYGSIIGPACSNGIVGIKPTAGLLSGFGIIPISNTLDTAGPMARTVRDAAILLSCLEGAYNNHYYRLGILNNGAYNSTDYSKGLDRVTLRGLRIGIYAEQEEKDDEFSKAFEEAITALEKAGAIINRDICSITPDDPWEKIGAVISKHEFKRCMDYYLAGGGMYVSAKADKSLADIVRFNEENKEKCLKYGQSVLLECLNETESRLTEPEYIKALRTRNTLINDLNKLYDEHKLDVLIGANEYISMAPLAGFPSGTLPIGERANGIPIGLYFIARRYEEDMLINAMYASEQLIGKRKCPRL